MRSLLLLWFLVLGSVLLIGHAGASRGSRSVVYHTSGAKTAALTFDDGPTEGSTGHILKVLARHNIRATFFVLGKNLESSEGRALLKKIYNAGHTIGTHSWHHYNMGSMSKQEVRKEIQRTVDLVYEIIGIKPTIFRPPYGEISNHMYSFTSRIVMWSIDTNDWMLTSGQITAQGVVDHTRALLNAHSKSKGPILLMHDLCYNNGEALEQIIQLLKGRKYRFTTL